MPTHAHLFVAPVCCNRNVRFVGFVQASKFWGRGSDEEESEEEVTSSEESASEEEESSDEESGSESSVS